MARRSRRQSADGSLEDAADAVSALCCRGDERMHVLCPLFIQHWELEVVQLVDLSTQLLFFLGEGLIAHLMALQDMGADQDPFAFEDLLGDGSGGDQPAR